MPIYLLAVGCVIGIATGQLLFKACANAMTAAGGALTPRALVLLVIALGLYGTLTLAWVWLLKHAELGKIYPIMALSFVLIPLASHFLFGEEFTPRYFAGIGLIMLGIAVVYFQG
ncbi:MAG: EamA family transporter [Pseudomonadota bacterium]